MAKWYLEVKNQFGQWVPQTHARKPDEKTPENRRLKFRNVQAIDPRHNKKTLNQLKWIYGERS